MKLCLAVSLAGVALAGGSAVALATSPSSRGGEAVAPKTTRAPLLPKQKRGIVMTRGVLTCTGHGGLPSAGSGAVGFAKVCASSR